MNRATETNGETATDDMRDFLLITMGTIFGAIAGAFIAAILGVALTVLILAITRSGEGPMEAGGLAIMAIPFGLVAGGFFGFNRTTKYLS